MSTRDVEGVMREDEIKMEKSRSDYGSVRLYSEFLNRILTSGDPFIEKRRNAYMRQLNQEIKPSVYDRLLEDTQRRAVETSFS